MGGLCGSRAPAGRCQKDGTGRCKTLDPGRPLPDAEIKEAGKRVGGLLCARTTWNAVRRGGDVEDEDVVGVESKERADVVWESRSRSAQAGQKESSGR